VVAALAGGPSDLARARRAPGFLDPLRSTLTIAAVLLVSLAFVLGLVTLLSYFKFESSLTTLAERRIGLIVEQARASIESVMRLGLKLEDIEAVRGVVEEARRRDPRIENIYVFRTDNARNIFSSDPTAIDAAVDPRWLGAQKASAHGLWRIQSGSRAVVGRRLDSSLAEGIGGIVVVYSLADVLARIATMRNNLILAAAVIFAGFGMVALVSAFFVTRGFRHAVGSLADAMGAADAPVAGASLPASLQKSVDGFRDAATEAHLHLDRFEATLAPSTEPKLAVGA